MNKPETDLTTIAGVEAEVERREADCDLFQKRVAGEWDAILKYLRELRALLKAMKDIADSGDEEKPAHGVKPNPTDKTSAE